MKSFKYLLLCCFLFHSCYSDTQPNFIEKDIKLISAKMLSHNLFFGFALGNSLDDFEGVPYFEISDTCEIRQFTELCKKLTKCNRSLYPDVRIDAQIHYKDGSVDKLKYSLQVFKIQNVTYCDSDDLYNFFYEHIME